VPEGDTIHRTAARLRPALEGKELLRFEAPRLVGAYRPRPGMVIDSVEAVGKHLLVRFETARGAAGALTLQVHLGMTGSWHLYARGERWRKPRHLARAVLVVEGWEAVCFSAPTVRAFVAGAGLASPIDHLGPDLCRPDVDLDAVLDRMARIPEPDTSIADVLLDQRVAAGVGNVYKSEVLWACRVDPFAPLSAVDRRTRRSLVETAARQLQANLGQARRETFRGGLAVYGRTRQTCPRCGLPVRATRQGEHQRVTYWCPSCQPPADRNGAEDGP
jgi:endonuclease-8